MQAAGQLGLDYLVDATVGWQDSHEECFACHTQGMTMWGASIGVQRGYQVDAAQLGQIVGRVDATQQPDGHWSHSGNIAPRFTTAFAASGLGFYDRFVATDAQPSLMAAVEWLRPQQAADGSWPSDSAWGAARSEVFRAHQIYTTMASVVAMSRAFEVTFMPIYKIARDDGVAWLRTVNDGSTQGLAFKLIGLLEGGVSDTDPDVAATRAQLLGHQNGDSGFGAFAGSTSTSYHTGLAVYTLRLAGMRVDEPEIDGGIQWLLDRQAADGSWPIGAAHLDATDPVAPSMWPVIALGEFGDLGVALSADPTEREILAGYPDTQIVTYTITVTNNGQSADTYDLAVSGGLQFFDAALDNDQVTLGAGASQALTLYVLAPRNLPPGMPVLHTVTAVSQTDANVTGSVTVNTFTPPTPPLIGHPTATVLIDGFGITVGTGDRTRIAARVSDLDTGDAVVGPGMGVVNFFVAGLAVGSDGDSDGDGVFEIAWLPGVDWPQLGAQSVMAVYSGIDRPDPLFDLLPSFDVQGITIEPTTDSACSNTAILVQEALEILRGMDINLPPSAPNGIRNKILAIIAKLEDVLARMNAGDCKGAANKLGAVFPQLDATISQIQDFSCTNKNGPNCIDESLVVILVDDLEAVRELLVRVLAALQA